MILRFDRLLGRAIHGTAASRFTHWAAPVYDYVRIHYARVAEIKSPNDTVLIFAKSLTPIAPDTP